MTKEQLADWALADQPLNECCRWPDIPPRADGYVDIHFQGRLKGAHTLIYEVKHGSIPPGYVVDHTCHDPKTCEGGLTCLHRSCINPTHLEIKTRGSNSDAERSVRHRPTACPAGHPYDEANTYVDARGSRHCRTCRTERGREERANREDYVDARFRKNHLCSKDHDVRVTGLTKGGKCAKCRREANRRYKAKVKAAT